MQVGDDPVAVGERVSAVAARPAPAAEAGVELVELAGDAAKLLPSASAASRRARAAARVLGESGERRRGELRLLADPRRSGDRGARGRRLERRTRGGLERRDEDRASSRIRRAPLRRGRSARDAVASRRGIVGRPASGFVRRKTSSQSGSSRSARSTARRAGARRGATRARRAFASARTEELGVDAFGRGGSRPGTARRRVRDLGEAATSASTRRGAGRAAPSRAGSRAARRRRSSRPQRRCVAQREVREARQPRLEAVDDVEPAGGEREARLARTPTGTPMRLRREIGTAGPSAITSASAPSAARPAPARGRPPGSTARARVTVVARARRSPAATRRRAR